MKTIAEKLNIVGIAGSIAGVVALITYYGFKTARDISGVFLNTDNRDLFGEIANWALWGGVGLFAFGLIFAGVSTVMRKEEISKKDIILGIGVPVLGIAALLIDFFVL